MAYLLVLISGQYLLRLSMKSDFYGKVFYDLCRRVDSPVSLGLWLRYCYAHDELAEATINPMDYNDADSFSRDYACVSYLRKFRGLDTTFDLEARAELSFRHGELECQRTNGLIWNSLATGQLARTDPAVLAKAQEIMRKIWRNPSADELFASCDWGPGSTASLKGPRSSREDKMSQFPFECSRSAIPYFRYVVSTDYLWLRHVLKQDVEGPVYLLDDCFRPIDESRLLTVPKDAKSLRTICAEPTCNIFLQKGIGQYIRSRLRWFGIDLDDQSRNQLLAERAYVEDLATLDLKAASDTISIAAVRLLCPASMFDVLNRTRSPAYRAKGEVSSFHKFSSMGNGFTFELESAIFYAVCKAVHEVRGCEKPVGVFGDDLIVSQTHAKEVVTFLEDLGFTVNKEKSFFSGNFYESCGKHFFMGIDVTPMYQKHESHDWLELVRAVNRLHDWLRRRELAGLDNSKLSAVHKNAVHRLPKGLIDLKVFGPSFLPGDDFIKMRGIDSVFNGREFVQRVLRGTRTKTRLADGGLYASYMRSFSKQEEHRPDSIPSYGKVDLRQSRPAFVGLGKRKIGTDCYLTMRKAF